MTCFGARRSAGCHQPAVGDRADLADVVLRFPVGGHAAAVAIDGPGAGVVGRQRQFFVALVLVQQLAQVGGPTADVLGGIVGVANAELARRPRHQLHQPHRAFRRPRPRIESRFHLDDRANEIRTEALARRVFPDKGLELFERVIRLQGPGCPERGGSRNFVGRRRGVEPAVGQHQVPRRVAPGVDLGIGLAGPGKRGYGGDEERADNHAWKWLSLRSLPHSLGCGLSGISV